MTSKPDYDNPKELSRAARLLSQRGAARGGTSRWTNVSLAERSEYGRKMALARWQKCRNNPSTVERDNASNPDSGVKNDE